MRWVAPIICAVAGAVAGGVACKAAGLTAVSILGRGEDGAWGAGMAAWRVGAAVGLVVGIAVWRIGADLIEARRRHRDRR